MLDIYLGLKVLKMIVSFIISIIFVLLLIYVFKNDKL